MITNKLRQERSPGISFIVRCHNEESYLEDCIKSLNGLNVPYEIILILHNCTDYSFNIGVSLQKEGYPITIVVYNYEISKTGFDTIVTPDKHSRSWVKYANYCLSFANCNWVFRWDAEFLASKELIKYLNSLDMELNTPQAHHINCMLGDVSNKEYYLSNSITHYTKHLFWEVGVYKRETEWIDVDDLICIKSIPVEVIKEYRKNKKWFLESETYDSIIAEKYKALIDLTGEEEISLASASNPLTDRTYNLIKKNEEYLNGKSIYLYF